MNELYWVHRLLTWPDGYDMVEVCENFDATSSDQLGHKYPELGEGRGYNNPKEAAITAVRVARQWSVDIGKPVELCWNSKFGGYMGIVPTDATALELFAWARKEYKQLERCSRCGEIIVGKSIEYYDIDDEVFCSEYCGEEAISDLYYEEEE